ncbi:hypothetical protein [Amycolatopsis sp. NPDC059021]|uniref:hypothetical protein n=1 Tax=Amycolatopsis sp. NPDC059021 TaxID=3346704 RepID=UPI0036703D9B
MTKVRLIGAAFSAIAFCLATSAGPAWGEDARASSFAEGRPEMSWQIRVGLFALAIGIGLVLGIAQRRRR